MDPRPDRPVLPRPPRCARHPLAVAPWRCGPCARELCAECAAAVPAGRGILPVCAACGALAEPVRVERSVVHPFETQIARAALAVLAPRGFALVALVAATVQTLASFEGVWWFIGQSLLWGWALWCARRAAHGYLPFAVPTGDDVAGAWRTTLPRAAASVGLPGVIAIWLVDWGHRAAPSTTAVVVLAALAAWLLPPAIVSALVEGVGGRWTPPWALASWSARLGSDAWPLRVAAATYAGASALSALQEPFDVRGGDLRLGSHIAFATGLRFLAVFALAALASLSGALVFSRAAELEHGDSTLQSVTIDAGVVPRGRRAR